MSFSDASVKVVSPLQCLAEVLYKRPQAGPLLHYLEAHLKLLCRIKQMNCGPLWKSRSVNVTIAAKLGYNKKKMQPFTRKMSSTYHLLLEVSV